MITDTKRKRKRIALAVGAVLALSLLPLLVPGVRAGYRQLVTDLTQGALGGILLGFSALAGLVLALHVLLVRLRWLTTCILLSLTLHMLLILCFNHLGLPELELQIDAGLRMEDARHALVSRLPPLAESETGERMREDTLAMRTDDSRTLVEREREDRPVTPAVAKPGTAPVNSTVAPSAKPLLETVAASQPKAASTEEPQAPRAATGADLTRPQVAHAQAIPVEPLAAPAPRQDQAAIATGKALGASDVAAQAKPVAPAAAPAVPSPTQAAITEAHPVQRTVVVSEEAQANAVRVAADRPVVTGTRVAAIETAHPDDPLPMAAKPAADVAVGRSAGGATGPAEVGETAGPALGGDAGAPRPGSLAEAKAPDVSVATAAGVPVGTSRERGTGTVSVGQQGVVRVGGQAAILPRAAVEVGGGGSDELAPAVTREVVAARRASGGEASYTGEGAERPAAPLRDATAGAAGGGGLGDAWGPEAVGGGGNAVVTAEIGEGAAVADQTVASGIGRAGELATTEPGAAPEPSRDGRRADVALAPGFVRGEAPGGATGGDMPVAANVQQAGAREQEVATLVDANPGSLGRAVVADSRVGNLTGAQAGTSAGDGAVVPLGVPVAAIAVADANAPGSAERGGRASGRAAGEALVPARRTDGVAAVGSGGRLAAPLAQATGAASVGAGGRTFAGEGDLSVGATVAAAPAGAVASVASVAGAAAGGGALPSGGAAVLTRGAGEILPETTRGADAAVIAVGRSGSDTLAAERSMDVGGRPALASAVAGGVAKASMVAGGALPQAGGTAISVNAEVGSTAAPRTWSMNERIPLAMSPEVNREGDLVYVAGGGGAGQALTVGRARGGSAGADTGGADAASGRAQVSAGGAGRPAPTTLLGVEADGVGGHGKIGISDALPGGVRAEAYRAVMASERQASPQMTRQKMIYALRSPEKRRALIGELGGSAETERAVERALTWMATAQSEDGRWDVNEFRGVGACGGAGDRLDGDVGVTGLALLAYLGAGYTQDRGDFRGPVRKGLDWLIAGQTADGDLRRGGQLYCQAMAAAALCEAYSLSGDASLLDPATRAVQFILKAQNPGAGWRYEPRVDSDTSVTGWQVLALKSAELAGIEVPREHIVWAQEWLERVRRGESGGLYAYKEGHGPTPVMTAEGWFCQLFMDPAKRAQGESESLAYLMENVPVWAPETRGVVHFYYWYYATLALHLSGVPQFDEWNQALRGALLAGQRSSGPAKGSWDPVDQLGERGGRLYATTMATLCLEVYYRYLPFYRTHVAP